MDTVDLLDAYLWELEFISGEKFNRKQWLAIPKENRFDPNKPNEVVKVVRMLPQQEGLMALEVQIPKKALPVVVREQHRAQGIDLFGVVFKLGFNLEGIRHMVCVRLPEKIVFQSLDHYGCR